MGRGYPGQTPNPSVVNVIEPGALLIPVAPGATIATAPAIKGGDVPKKIDLTTNVVFAGAEALTFTLQRDGVPIGSVYAVSEGAVTTQVYSMHWYDAAPGKGAPVYTVVAVGSTGGVATAGAGRTFTVHNV